MKKSSLIVVTVLMSLMFTFAMGSSSGNMHRPTKGIDKVVGNIDIVLQNKCTRDVKYSLKSGGATTNGVVPAGGKVKVSIAVGTEICVDGDAFMTAAASDASQTFMVCR